MKRFAALLTAILLLMSCTALAFDGVGYPEWDGESAPENSLCGSFGGERISLVFDSSDDYSNVQDGIVQACFYAYDASDTYYLEMYLLIPQDAATGDVLAGGQGLDCAIWLYESSPDTEVFYFAGDLGSGLPAANDFEITIDSAETTGSVISMRGHLNAALSCYDAGLTGAESLRVEDIYFSFSVPTEADSFAPAPTMEPFPSDPDQPASTFPALPELPDVEGGAPAFTLPPHYVTL